MMFGVRQCLVTFVIIAVAAMKSGAQCVPDTDVQGLYEPTSAEGLPPAYVGQQYEAVISLNVPDDTAYLSYNFTVDSLVLTNIQGLPAGFSYLCAPPSCGFPGGEYGCILLTGLTFENGFAGDYDLVAEFDFHIKYGSIATVLPYELDEYTLTLNATGPAAVSDISRGELAFFVEPSPVNENSRAVFTLPGNGEYNISVFSLLGAEVGRIQAFGKQGIATSVPLSEFTRQPGVYFLSLTQGDYTRSLRFVVQ